MRFLPLVLVGFMAAPVFIWALVETLLVQGTSGKMFGFESGPTVAVLIGFGIVALGLLGTWMMRFIARDEGRA
ncbi:hypothetical protein C882_3399 [Caenispirillum salinarum AK4]|uniref:Uncharacterized protein n=1 Tax=Caenispirillum salinarum AK4 TaxID=1238182 RepID=K9H3Q9_9PROT|nr:hypothetical protein [Caenispirillum salinarum]EKV31649.1 hypothetical protein C882_3399 [Caenispirillum salinarum AK4]